MKVFQEELEKFYEKVEYCQQEDLKLLRAYNVQPYSGKKPKRVGFPGRKVTGTRYRYEHDSNNGVAGRDCNGRRQLPFNF
jgi:hypothetical protein